MPSALFMLQEARLQAERHSGAEWIIHSVYSDSFRFD